MVAFNNHPLQPTPLLLLCSCFFFLLLSGFCLQESNGQLETCNLSKIKVTTHKTGVDVEDDDHDSNNREFLVVVSNVCWCPQSNVTVHCDRFGSVQAVDPALFRVVGKDESGRSFCLVNDGKPVVNGRPIGFKYVWPDRFHFRPRSSEILC